MGFLDMVSNEIKNKKIKTENGAIGYASSGKELLDINFSASSLRNEPQYIIQQKFAKAYYEDPILATKWLFYLRDIRGNGMGERHSFRTILQWLANNHPNETKVIFPLIPEYGRYDDIWCLLETNLKKDVIEWISIILQNDIKALKNDENISLLAKWLPSCNASSCKTKQLANIICNELGYTQERYRKTLSSLRQKLDIVERKMSANQWNLIIYEHVPSRANLIYRNAFYKNDTERRTKYLENLQKGETTINASTVFPSDILSQYVSYQGYSYEIKDYDISLEEMWKSLPDYTNGDTNTLVIRDGSGSMLVPVSKTKTTALDIATSLAIYFAQHCKGEFHNKFMTFAATPNIIDISNAPTLRDKISLCYNYSDYTSTNIKALFYTLLDTAINKKLSQKDMPDNLLIVSDMEFDRGISYTLPLFEEIKISYKRNGYRLPRLIFWNVCSRTMTIPLRENSMGMALVSGFSPSIYDMVLSNEFDPYKCLVDTLNSDRYQIIEDAIKSISFK